MAYVRTWRELRRHQKGRFAPRALLRHAWLSMAGLSFQGSSEPSLRLLFCHYVFDDQVDAFDRIVSFFAQRGTFVSADEVVDILEGEKPLDRPYFHLSFDDGFRNIVTNALPVLRRQGIPATFFVPTRLIGASEGELEEFCFRKSGYQALIEMANWDELGMAAESGLEIASHTRTHDRLSEISGSRERLAEEIAGSKEDVERSLGIACKHFSWPYGRIADADPVALEQVRQAGYRACFGGFRGRVRPGVTDRYAIPRHHFEVQWPFSHVRYFGLGGKDS